MRLNLNKDLSCNSVLRVLGPLLLTILLSLGACSDKKDKSVLPDNFNNLSTNDKMAYLMKEMQPDTLAGFICNVAMGKVHNVRIELQQARAYAYEHYNEDQLIDFEEEFSRYEKALPLHDKVKFSKLAALEDPDKYSYELGLSYVSAIREDGKSIKDVSEELEKLQNECKTDPDFYKRFMTGFKLALEYDRSHDLDDNIYLKFITYPDSITQ